MTSAAAPLTGSVSDRIECAPAPAMSARAGSPSKRRASRAADWIAGQLDKVACGLAALETRAGDFGDRVDVGTIAWACSLGYLDFRFASLAWRDRHPNAAAWFAWFGGRESMMFTRPS